MRFDLIKKHCAGLVLAVAVGLIMIAPTLVFRYSLRSAYRGIDPILLPQMQDGIWYHASVKEALEGGHPWTAVMADNKDMAYPMMDGAEKIIAWSGKIFSSGPVNLLLAWGFVLSFLLALALYAIGFFLANSRAFAVAGTAGVFGWSYFIYMPKFAWQALLGQENYYGYIIFNRPVHPQFEAYLLWLCLFFSVLAMSRQRKVFWLSASILLGAATYTYPWAWTWGYAMMLVLLAIAYLQHDVKGAKQILKTWFLAVVVGLPSLIKTLFSLDAELAERVALQSNRLPGPLQFNLPVIVALIALFASKRYWTADYFRFALGGLGATLVALNQQIVTGKYFAPDHYVYLIGASLVIWTLWWSVWVRSGSLKKIFASVFFGASLLAVIIFQINSYRNIYTFTAGIQPFADVASWLNKNGTKQTVVYANAQIGMLIPVYTSANLWWHWYSMVVPQPEQRITEAAFITLALYDFQPEQLNQLFLTSPIEATDFFTITTAQAERLEYARQNRERLVLAYRNFLNGPAIAEVVRRYPVDFLLYDKELDNWDEKRLGITGKVFENSRFILYQMR